MLNTRSVKSTICAAIAIALSACSTIAAQEPPAAARFTPLEIKPFKPASRADVPASARAYATQWVNKEKVDKGDAETLEQLGEIARVAELTGYSRFPRGADIDIIPLRYVDGKTDGIVDVLLSHGYPMRDAELVDRMIREDGFSHVIPGGTAIRLDADDPGASPICITPYNALKPGAVDGSDVAMAGSPSDAYVRTANLRVELHEAAHCLSGLPNGTDRDSAAMWREESIADLAASYALLAVAPPDEVETTRAAIRNAAISRDIGLISFYGDASHWSSPLLKALAATWELPTGFGDLSDIRNARRAAEAAFDREFPDPATAQATLNDLSRGMALFYDPDGSPGQAARWDAIRAAVPLGRWLVSVDELRATGRTAWPDAWDWRGPMNGYDKPLDRARIDKLAGRAISWKGVVFPNGVGLTK